jgi:cold shock CspA family protein
VSIPAFVFPRLSEVVQATGLKTGAILLGQVKWFGGINNSTGRENHYGFIEADGVAFFVHRSAVLSPQASMIEGAEVLFHRLEDRSGKPAATAVRVLSIMSNDELVVLLKETPNPSPDLVLTIALIRKELAPFRNEVSRALIELGATKPKSSLLGRFWNDFSPSRPSDRLYALAPEAVKSQVCKKHYSAVRHALLNLLGRDNGPPTSITAQELYPDLDEHDRKLAAIWAGSEKDAIVAQMLSARAAEKAVARLYRKAGAIVDDVAITQLDGAGSDWITHDLTVDQTIPIDVKNARRPINSKHFYVEHTVPRFKLDRSGSDVRIAGVLSPYLQKRFIDKASAAGFKIDDIVFLGETSRRDINDLITKYRSPHFEVVRGNERIFPNWVFGHPARWYPELQDKIQRATDLCRDIPEDDWRYIFGPDEAGDVVAALCAMRMALPLVLADRHSEHQANFYNNLQRNLKGIPDVPTIFLAVISDFVEAVFCDRQDYSPAIYASILFPKGDHVIPLRAISSFFDQNRASPLGAIDPLNLVASLVMTLTLLWEKRSNTALREFSSFRFGGLGLLQARRNDRVEWTTILAYCGGTEYDKGEDGKILLSEEGRPMPKGKCGHTPLVFGNHQTCPNCRKLLCDKCGFCSVMCRDEAFGALMRDRDSVARPRKNGFLKDSDRVLEAPPWEPVPWEAYEQYLR